MELAITDSPYSARLCAALGTQSFRTFTDAEQSDTHRSLRQHELSAG